MSQSAEDGNLCPSTTNSQIISLQEAIHNVYLEFDNACVESILVLNNSMVNNGQTIVHLKSKILNESKEICISIKSPVDGELVCNLKDSQFLKKGDLLFSIIVKCCHPVIFRGLCCLCGKNVDPASGFQKKNDSDYVNMVHDATGVTVSKKVAQDMDKETSDRLRSLQKLSLILDLDQTLVHATSDTAVASWLDSSHPQIENVYRFNLDKCPVEYFLRLRPGLREFLKSVQEKYELHIYTMGSRPYAQKVASIIDQEGTIFKERILSRDESGCHYRKSISRLFPCDQSMVVVVDDRGDVWNWAENLIKVHPYSYFLKTGDINAPPDARSESIALVSNQLASEIPVKLIDKDKELCVLLSKLYELHSLFYSCENSDVRKILPAMKAKVLDGCFVHFCDENDLLQYESRILAASFGAHVQKQIAHDTTHVIARGPEYPGVIEAYRKNIKAVSYSWLFTSFSFWTKQSTKKFRLPKPKMQETEIQSLEIFFDEEDAQMFSSLGEELRMWMGDDYEQVEEECRKRPTEENTNQSEKRQKQDLDEIEELLKIDD